MSSNAYRPLYRQASRESLSDAAPLLQPPGSDLKSSDEDVEGSAGMRSSIANLCNTILGTGMLAMAHAVAAGGLISGVLTIILSGGMAALGLHLLACCATRLPPRQSSFFSLAQLTYPRAAVVFDAAIAIKCFGVAISYLIILSSLIPKVVLAFAPHSADVPRFLLDRSFWIIVCVCILSPICFLRKLHSLRFISYFALLAVLDLLIIVAFKSIDRHDLEPRGRVDLFRWSSALLSSLPVYVFAYTCAQNLHSVHNELRNNSPARVDAVIVTSIGSAAVIYQLIGVLGYLSFGNKVTANIMDEYPPSFLVNQCRLMIAIFVLFSYPLQIHPCRASLDKVVLAVIDDSPSPALSQSAPTPDTVALGPPDGPAPVVIPQLRFIVLTISLLVLTTLVALLVTSLEAVLGVVGATGSTTISFLLPGAFYLKLFPASAFTSGKDRLRRIGAKVLLVLGFLVMSLCLALNISELVHPHKTPGRGVHSHPPGNSTDPLPAASSSPQAT